MPFFNVTFYVHPLVYIFFAMFVMVGCVNAVNLTDGIDGLSSSVTIPVMVFFTAAASAMGKSDLALLPAALAGGLVAYLFYNFHPAKVFMGDTGSCSYGRRGVRHGLCAGYALVLILRASCMSVKPCRTLFRSPISRRPTASASSRWRPSIITLKCAAGRKKKSSLCSQGCPPLCAWWPGSSIAGKIG